jgi:hypothetical protein
VTAAQVGKCYPGSGEGESLRGCHVGA